MRNSKSATLLLSICLCLPAMAQAPSEADQQAAETAFKNGAALMGKEQFPQALVEFQKALKVFPDEGDILWNAGTAAFSAGQYKLAANYFERDIKAEPLNGQLYARLVQTYQELGDLPHRDAMRAKVFAIRKSGKDESGYTKSDRYCRDQFTLNGRKVFAFERFELVPRSKAKPYLAPRYDFLVALPGQEEPEVRLEVGWDTVEPDGKGGYRPAKENNAVYFDAYYAKGEYSRKTFGLLPTEPTYEVCKQRLINIVNGKVAMTSGRKRSEMGPGD